MRRGELAHHAQIRRLVRITGEQAVELEETALEIDALGGQQFLEIRLGLIDALRRDQERRHDLQRRGRFGLDLLPSPRRLERELGQLRLIGDLHRAARNARVAGAPGELQVSLGGKGVIAPLQGDLAEQELVERRLVQLLCIGLGKRGAGNGECGSNCQGEKQADQHRVSTDVRYIWCPAQATCHA